MAEEEFFDFFGLKRKNKQEETSETRQVPQGENDFFSRFMFGNRREPEPPKSTLVKILDDIDVDQVLSHIDTLVSSANELKPLINKARPFFDQFVGKNKSASASVSPDKR